MNLSANKKGPTMLQVSSPKIILEDVMPLRIIREVEKWPVIYQRDSPEMTNPHFKYKVWEEVAKNLFDNYQIYSAAEKKARVTGLMKKWRNLRDTFRRQLVVEKKNREGHNIKKKEYVYFKHMAFLLPHMTEDEARAPGAAAAVGGARRALHGQLARCRRRAHEPPPAPAVEHIDEDKHFLLSLLPSFKRMNEDEKLTAKMEILKVIKDVKNSSMALETFVVDDTLALADAPSEEDEVVVKKEMTSVDVRGYKSPSDSGSGDTE